MNKISLLVLTSLIWVITSLWADQGGNDSFGHMWTDSKGTVTVPYEWIDINSSSNQIFAPGFNGGSSWC